MFSLRSSAATGSGTGAGLRGAVDSSHSSSSMCALQALKQSTAAMHQDKEASRQSEQLWRDKLEVAERLAHGLELQLRAERAAVGGLRAQVSERMFLTTVPVSMVLHECAREAFALSLSGCSCPEASTRDRPDVLAAHHRTSCKATCHADEQQFKGTSERVETLQVMAAGLQEQVVRLAAQADAGLRRFKSAFLWRSSGASGTCTSFAQWFPRSAALPYRVHATWGSLCGLL